MAIYVDPRGGSLIIDRKIRGARFKRSTGVPDTPLGRKTAKLYNSMIDTLLHSGRHDLVRGLASNVLHFADIWPHFRVGDWTRIPSPDHMRPLFGAVDEWLPKAKRANGRPISESHRTSMGNAFKALKKLRADAKIIELPELLAEYRELCERRGIGRTFAKVKATCQSFVRETQGKRRSHLWADIADIPGVAYERDVMGPRTVEQAKAIREALAPWHAEIWWSMCCTGAMPDEYWGGKWRVGTDHVHILGTKTAGRNRLVPLIDPPVEPARRYKAFCVALKEIDPELTPYVARRTYAHWLEEAGIKPTRVRRYMGHVVRTTTDLYLDHDVAPYLAGDAEALRRLLGIAPAEQPAPSRATPVDTSDGSAAVAA